MEHHVVISDVLKPYPIIGFIACILGITVSSLLQITPHHWEFPIWVMQMGQIISWIFVYLTGFITVLNAIEKYFDVKFNFKKYFKRNKKAKK
jgi:hypothetical protein